MPTIAELIKNATKFEYEFGGAKVTVEKKAIEADKTHSPGRDEYFALRDSVWKKIRSVVKEYELFQKYLKSEMRKHEDCKNKLYRRMIAAKAIDNTNTLHYLYMLIQFTKHGVGFVQHELAEEFFNNFFHKNIEFRNDYWTYWNKRHNKNGKLSEKKTETSKVVVKESSNKPYRCPSCNRFVSRKTNFCSNCNKKVSPND